MLNISKEWYRKALEDYVISKYGSLDVLSQYDTILYGEIGDHMYKEVVKYYQPSVNDITRCMTENRKLCSECINRYRG